MQHNPKVSDTLCPKCENDTKICYADVVTTAVYETGLEGTFSSLNSWKDYKKQNIFLTQLTLSIPMAKFWKRRHTKVNGIGR